ncbi:MAG: Bax inhibitor-1/YccA family protein [Chthoniobacter sp.]|uniref:Bax inhibitor-1/YccA family protein n=1 Tax=Chthoniobacter sp. TaxID=2510640 RepID=UPI0032AAF4AE
MTGNPTLSPKTFTEAGRVMPGEAMTVQGTVNKTAILLLLTTVAAAYTWQLFWKGETAFANLWLMGGAIGGLIMAMITIFKKEWAGVTAPVYAVFEGLFIGGISSLFEKQFPGIVIQAVMLTFGTLAALLAAYTMGLIRASSGFRRGIFAATGGIAILYLVSMVLGLFHIQIPLIFGAGPVGILFSVAVVIIAALNLVIDFDFIESGAQQGAPKYLEWYGAFGLMVTLIWLYMEILRLLSKLNRR